VVRKFPFRTFFGILSSSILNIQSVLKRALQLWKHIAIYTEDIHNVLNCQNVAKHTEFYLG
jgi:hypothetical protein